MTYDPFTDAKLTRTTHHFVVRLTLYALRRCLIVSYVELIPATQLKAQYIYRLLALTELAVVSHKLLMKSINSSFPSCYLTHQKEHKRPL